MDDMKIGVDFSDPVEIQTASRIAVMVDALKMVLWDQNMPPLYRGAALDALRKIGQSHRSRRDPVA